MSEHEGRSAESGADETRWVSGRLRRVRTDGTLGTTCVHGVGLDGGLWCGGCIERALNNPPGSGDADAEVTP